MIFDTFFMPFKKLKRTFVQSQHKLFRNAALDRQRVKKTLNAFMNALYGVWTRMLSIKERQLTKNARRHSRHTAREKFCSSGDIYKSSSAEAAARGPLLECVMHLLTLFVGGDGGGCTELIQFAFILARGHNSRIHFEAVAALKNEYLPGCELIWHSERVDKLN
jgi:hypothetical protein